jgi:hypothetical protein
MSPEEVKLFPEVEINYWVSDDNPVVCLGEK